MQAQNSLLKSQKVKKEKRILFSKSRADRNDPAINTSQNQGPVDPAPPIGGRGPATRPAP